MSNSTLHTRTHCISNAIPIYKYANGSWKLANMFSNRKSQNKIGKAKKLCNHFKYVGKYFSIVWIAHRNNVNERESRTIPNRNKRIVNKIIMLFQGMFGLRVCLFVFCYLNQILSHLNQCPKGGYKHTWIYLVLKEPKLLNLSCIFAKINIKNSWIECAGIASICECASTYWNVLSRKDTCDVYKSSVKNRTWPALKRIFQKFKGKGNGGSNAKISLCFLGFINP